MMIMLQDVVEDKQLTYTCTTKTTDMYLYITSTSIKGCGHDDHSQSNVRHMTWS